MNREVQQGGGRRALPASGLPVRLRILTPERRDWLVKAGSRLPGSSLDSPRTIPSGIGFAALFLLLFGVNVLMLSLGLSFGLSRWPFAILWWYFPYGFLLAWQTFISPDDAICHVGATIFGAFIAFRCGQLYAKWAHEGWFRPSMFSFVSAACFAPVTLMLGFSWLFITVFHLPGGE